MLTACSEARKKFHVVHAMNAYDQSDLRMRVVSLETRVLRHQFYAWAYNCPSSFESDFAARIHCRDPYRCDRRVP